MSQEKEALAQLRIDRSAPPKRRGGLFFAIIFVTLAAAVLAFLLMKQREPTTEIRAVVAATPVPSPPKAGDTLLNASGYVTARRMATVSSKVMGKVMEVLVEEGMQVEQDQVLAKLDASNVETSLQLAEAQLDSSRKQQNETNALLDRAESELRRVSRLVATNAASQSGLDQAEADARSLRARLDRQAADVVVAEREVATWKQQIDDNVIRAPFPGVVTSKNAQPGEMISPMSSGGFTRTGICTIVDMRSLEIEVDVNESFINRVEAGQPVLAKLDAYPEWEIPAKVIAVIPTADRQKATVKVRIGFMKLDPRILPEMGVKVAFLKTKEQ